MREGGDLLLDSCHIGANAVAPLKMANSRKNELNVAAIKPQYIFKEETNIECCREKTESCCEDGESPEKKARLETETGMDDGKKNKNWKYPKSPRFRNRDRSSGYGNICKTLIDVPVNGPMPVCESLRCRYLHDINKFLQSKPPDIGEECHVFNLKGHCPRGISCRFSSKHITENGRNIVNEERKEHYEKNLPKTLSFYTREIDVKLRMRLYDFKKSEEILDILPKVKPPPLITPFGPFTPPSWGTSEIDFTEDIDVPIPPQPDVIPPLIEEAVGPCPDDDLFQLHLAEKKKITWQNKLYLLSMANFGNLPFRRICKEYGADVTCSEMVIATSILESQPFEWLLTKKHETEDLFGIQLFGNNPFSMTRCAQLLEEKTNIDFIDVNVASPGEMVMRPRGTNQIRREKAAETIVRCISRVTSLPVTVLTRLCDYSDEKISSKYLQNYRSCQVSLVTVHGRNRDSKQIDWEYTNNLAKRLSPVEVFGLSDIFSYSDFLSVKQNYPDVAGVLIGRGALVKPWIFGEIKEQRDWDISSSERFEILKRFVNYGLEHWGSDTKGVELTRKFLLEWLSFLCRYIPLGLLEHPPQKVNDRSPRYIGRNDMETLLGSHDSSDWVKISEMLLGPYPENYQFVPRIKANMWPMETYFVRQFSDPKPMPVLLRERVFMEFTEPKFESMGMRFSSEAAMALVTRKKLNTITVFSLLD